MRSYFVFLSLASLATADFPQSILGKRARPQQFDEVETTVVPETMDDDEEVAPLPAEPIVDGLQYVDAEIGTLTLLSVVPDMSFQEFKRGMESFGFSHPDILLRAMFDGAMKPTQAPGDFVQLLFHESHLLTSPMQVADLSVRIARFYSKTPGELRFTIELWLQYCINPLVELNRRHGLETANVTHRPCYELPSGEWILSDAARSQYFGQRLAQMTAARMAAYSQRSYHYAAEIA